jgi:hypothetical protein
VFAVVIPEIVVAVGVCEWTGGWRAVVVGVEQVESGEADGSEAGELAGRLA